MSTSLARIVWRLAHCIAGLLRHHRTPALATQAGVCASLFGEAQLSAVGARMTVAPTTKLDIVSTDTRYEPPMTLPPDVERGSHPLAIPRSSSSGSVRGAGSGTRIDLPGSVHSRRTINSRRSIPTSRLSCVCQKGTTKMPMMLTIQTTGRDRRAPSLSALAAAEPVPRASQRKVGSNSAPLLPPRAKSLTEPRRHGARILPGGGAGQPDRPPHHEDAGGSRSISVRPCRDTRRGRLGCLS